MTAMYGWHVCMEEGRMTEEVWKVQRSFGPDPQLLLYTKGKALQFQIPESELQEFSDQWPDEPKVYVNAYIEGETFVIVDEAEEPDW